MGPWTPPVLPTQAEYRLAYQVLTKLLHSGALTTSRSIYTAEARRDLATFIADAEVNRGQG